MAWKLVLVAGPEGKERERERERETRDNKQTRKEPPNWETTTILTTKPPRPVGAGNFLVQDHGKYIKS